MAFSPEILVPVAAGAVSPSFSHRLSFPLVAFFRRLVLCHLDRQSGLFHSSFFHLYEEVHLSQETFRAAVLDSAAFEDLSASAGVMHAADRDDHSFYFLPVFFSPDSNAI